MTERERGAKRRQSSEYREAQKKRYKRWYKKYGKAPARLKRKATQMRRYARDPRLRMRHMARWIVQRALKIGRLRRGPCEVVTCHKRAQAHHKDYMQPLKVRWLCPMHHRSEHAKAEGKDK